LKAASSVLASLAMSASIQLVAETAGEPELELPDPSSESELGYSQSVAARFSAACIAAAASSALSASPT
jgi:hypothetical protein